MQRFHPTDPARVRPIDNASEHSEGGSISSMWRGTILDSIADGVFTVDDSWHITSFNRAAERITGYAKQEVMGRPCYEVFRTSICRSRCALRQTMNTGNPIVNVLVEAVAKDGKKLPLSVSTAILCAPDGRRVGGVETFRDMSAANEFDEAFDEEQRMGIVGRHGAIQRIVDVLPDVAHSDAPVLLEGPMGAGKTLITRTIHALSSRREQPFVRLCCSALPEPWLEHELFGGCDEHGREHQGRVRLGEGGTLVLDEVGEMSLAVQEKLLQLLRTGEFRKKGSDRSHEADVRILACTRKDLSAMVEAGTLLRDLYDQLKVVRLSVPSLAERKQDIPLLVDRCIARHRDQVGKAIRGVTEEVMSLLMNHDFPGNVRELESALEHAFVLCQGDMIESQHLPVSIVKGGNRFRVGEASGISNPRQAAEAEVIRQTLERNEGNRLAAARELDMHRTTLWRKLKQYGITYQEK